MSHPVQEEDRVAVGKIIVVAVTSLTIFGAGVWWSVWIQRDEAKSIVQQSQFVGPNLAGASEVGIVYQKPFNLSKYAEEKVEDRRWQLEHYGWLDKSAKTVHIPIEQAMDKYLHEAGGAK